MKKSWADHDSSDDESEGKDQQQRLRKSELKDNVDGRNHVPTTSSDVIPDNVDHNTNHEDGDYDTPPPLPLADFRSNYPELNEVLSNLQGPPFSAHIGNLPYRIQTSDQFSKTIEDLVAYRYQGQEKVHVSSCRLAVDRETRKLRGFGNVNFDTLDELTIFLNISDGYCFIDGRQIKINIAKPKTPNPNHKYAEIDGSKFRGGKYIRNTATEVPHSSSMNSISGAAPSASLSRNKTSSDDNNLVRNTSTSSTATSITSDKQRPTLKLMPRSKPIEGSNDADVKASADIFGGAKPRNESNWTTTDKTSFKNDTDKEKRANEEDASNAVAVDPIGTGVTPRSTVKDVDLKIEPVSSTSSRNENQKHEKKAGPHREPRNVNYDRSNAATSGRPQRTNLNREDRTKQVAHHQGPKDVRTERHENKSKGSSNRPVKDRAKVNVDGWEDTPANQKEKPANLQAIVSPPVPTPAAPSTKKKPVNAYEALAYDDSDSD